MATEGPTARAVMEGRLRVGSALFHMAQACYSVEEVLLRYPDLGCWEHEAYTEHGNWEDLF